MAIHWIRLIQSGHMSTARLFDLAISLRTCKRNGRWPSLETMNSFLAGGTDDGELGTDVEWEPTELTQSDYENALATVMGDAKYTVASEPLSWEEWQKLSSAGGSPA